jgi:hypothetical protein
MGIAALLGSLLLLRYFRHKWHVWRRMCRLQRGLRAEGCAERVLRRYGYEMYAIQKNIAVSVWVDGELRSYTVRPDGMARRGRNIYVVEVKTGSVATDPLYRDTRRQLLEYSYALPVAGVLLVDGDSETVKRIFFNRTVERGISKLWWLVLGGAAGAILSWSYLSRIS